MTQVVRLASETDFAGWRRAARTLRAGGVAPDDAVWTVDGAGDLFDDDAVEPKVRSAALTVPRAFMELADAVMLHRSDERFALLYRLLWRLGADPGLLRARVDPDLDKARGFAKAVAQAEHRMKAFVRFQPVAAAAADRPGWETYVAWFEPAHRVTEAAAPFFARRFAGKRFSLLTPDVCAHWDGATLSFTPGADPADAPRSDTLEDYWRNRYATVFPPGSDPVVRLAGAPQRYWRNLPDTRLIPELIERAEARAAAMPDQPPPAPSRPPLSDRVVRAAVRASRDAPYDGQAAAATLEELAAGVQMCRRCDLYRDATQAVAGEGPVRARLMLVGEQPGDQEDLAGRPFVGPAGLVLDKALAEAGVPRAQTYVTNAVKHFKHELRGKRRLHKTPTTGEVTACRGWLDSERRIVRPRVIVALGATAALAVFGKPMPIARMRHQALPLPDQVQGVVTYHPSFLLRAPDAETAARAHAQLVEDLKFAWKLAG